MPSLRHGYLWVAKRKRNSQVYYLGSFSSKARAIAAEDEFDKLNPPSKYDGAKMKRKANREMLNGENKP